MRDSFTVKLCSGVKTDDLFIIIFLILGWMAESYLPTRRGFQTTYGYWSGFVDPMSKATPMNYYNVNRTGYMFYDDDEVDLTADDRHVDELFAERAERIIKEQAEAASPFFLYLTPLSPHFPQLLAEYTRPEVLTALTLLDALVSRVVKALKQTGLYNNTIIVFSSDNGGDPNFGGNNLPLRGKKETLWEGGMRVPSFVHSPLLSLGADVAEESPPKRGVVSNQLFHITDWLPTLLRAAGVSSEKIHRLALDGVDQWEALLSAADVANGPALPTPRTAAVLNLNLNSYGRLEAALRDGPYKLIVNTMRPANDWLAPLALGRRDPAAVQLFHLLQDPGERVNVAANLTQITRSLVKKVGSWKIIISD